MENEIDERPRKKKRKKKKSKFGYYLYAVIVLVLTIANITLAFLLLFHVQKVEISGNQYSKKNEILEWVKEDPYTSNSMYAFVKFKTGSYEKPVYLEKIKVGLGAPWKLKINVEEKKIVGCIQEDSQYVYFDKEGLVMVKESQMIEGVPLFEGLEAGPSEQYKKLSLQNEKAFTCILEMMEQVKKNKLNPDRIVWENDSMNLYFEEICVRFGKTRFDEKIIQIPPILEKLNGKKGILHLEHYNETSTNISFEQSVEMTE